MNKLITLLFMISTFTIGYSSTNKSIQLEPTKVTISTDLEKPVENYPIWNDVVFYPSGRVKYMNDQRYKWTFKDKNYIKELNNFLENKTEILNSLKKLDISINPKYPITIIENECFYAVLERELMYKKNSKKNIEMLKKISKKYELLSIDISNLFEKNSWEPN